MILLGTGPFALLFLSIQSVASLATFGPRALYVNTAQSGPADGSSWATAYPDLQEALAVAVPGQDIWTAQGTYHPDAGTGTTSISFAIPDGVGIYGGFDGTETELAQRDVIKNVTILSGDLLDNDLPGFGNISDNSLHVVRITNTVGGVTLDGLRITAGNAAKPVGDKGKGAGVYIDSAQVHLRNCTIDTNRCVSTGSGVFGTNASIDLDSCTIEHDAGSAFAVNVAHSYLWVNRCAFDSNANGALRIQLNSSALISESSFAGNKTGTGAGIFQNATDGGHMDVSRCRFLGNQSANGAAIAIFVLSNGGRIPTGVATIVDCEFSGNVGESSGGTVIVGGAGVGILRCTFAGNTSKAAGCGLGCLSCTASVQDTVFWNNTAQGIPDPEAQIDFETGFLALCQLSTSDIQGLDATLSSLGLGNFDADPQFVSASGPDRIAGTYDDDLALSPVSPCVDNGSYDELTGSDVAGVPRWLDGDLDGQLRVDVGAHEYSNVDIVSVVNDKGIKLTVNSMVPLVGYLFVGRPTGSKFIAHYGELLLDPALGLKRYALGSLPVTVAFPWTSVAPALLGAEVSVQALGIVPGTSHGNFSKAVIVPLVAP